MYVNWVDKNILYFLDYSKEPPTSAMARLARHSQPQDLKGQTILGFVGTPFREKGIQGTSPFCLYFDEMSFTLSVN